MAIDYGLGLRQRALDRTTDADLGRLKRERADRIMESGKRSDLQKLLSAGARGLAAYYTGGLSETMGGGQMIDQAMLGTDSEGRPVRNEYGKLVEAAGTVYQAGMSVKDAKLARQDAKYDKLRNRRMGIVQSLFDADQPELAMDKVREIENMDLKYMGKRKGMEGGNPFAYSEEDYSALSPSSLTVDQRKAQEEQLNQAAKGQPDQGPNVVGPPSVLSSPSVQQAQTQTQPPSSSPSGGWTPSSPSAKTLDIADVESQALAKKKAQRERLDAIGDSGPAMYGDARRKDRIDFSDALLSPEERRRVGMQGHFTGLK